MTDEAELLTSVRDILTRIELILERIEHQDDAPSAIGADDLRPDDR